jgi:hypothetical protein
MSLATRRMNACGVSFKTAVPSLKTRFPLEGLLT